MPPAQPLIVHLLHRLDLAGAEVLAAALARQLQGERQHFRFAFFCLDGLGSLGEALLEEGYAVEVLHRRPGIDLPLAARLGRLLRAYRADLVHAHQFTPWCYAALARTLPNPLRRRPPILFTEHGRHYPDRRSPRRVAFNRLMLGPRDRVTAVGEFVREALRVNEGIPRHRIDVIHNGIDPARFTADPEHLQHHRDHARHILGLAPEHRVVMHVARFHPVKDHLTGLRAFALAANRLPEARLVLVGDGDERPAIEAAIERLGLPDRVLLTGVRDDVSRLLPAADVFLLSSLSEGISVTLLEAMATRLPICATDVGGNPEVVEHLANGLLSPRGDEHALADNLHRLLTDPDTGQRMGNAGYERLLDRFDQRDMHDAYERLYHAMT